MANKSTSSRDQRIADTSASIISTTSRGERQQIVSITDLISEGEIEGLVYGEASIYLNDERVKDIEKASISQKSAYRQCTNNFYN